MRLGGRATAAECKRGLVLAASNAADARATVRFARSIDKHSPSSCSQLALAFGLEHASRPAEALWVYVTAMGSAQREGDFHRKDAAAAGVARTSPFPRPRRISVGCHPEPNPTLEPLTHLRKVLGLP